MNARPGVDVIAIIVAKCEDPDDPTCTRENLSDRITKGAREACVFLEVPEDAQISLSAFHDDECPANPKQGGFSADFDKCTCEAVQVAVGIMDPEYLKIQLAKGADSIRYAGEYGGKGIEPGKGN